MFFFVTWVLKLSHHGHISQSHHDAHAQHIDAELFFGYVCLSLDAAPCHYQEHLIKNIMSHSSSPWTAEINNTKNKERASKITRINNQETFGRLSGGRLFKSQADPRRAASVAWNCQSLRPFFPPERLLGNSFLMVFLVSFRLGKHFRFGHPAGFFGVCFGGRCMLNLCRIMIMLGFWILGRKRKGSGLGYQSQHMVHSILDFSLFRSSGLKGLKPYPKRQDFMGEALKKRLWCAPVSEQTLQVHV